MEPPSFSLNVVVEMVAPSPSASSHDGLGCELGLHAASLDPGMLAMLASLEVALGLPAVENEAQTI